MISRGDELNREFEVPPDESAGENDDVGRAVPSRSGVRPSWPRVLEGTKRENLLGFLVGDGVRFSSRGIKRWMEKVLL